MISLLKTQEYSAIVRGTERTVKVLHKDMAVEYFQSIDNSVMPDQVKRVKNGSSKSFLPIEHTAEAFPNHTNL